MRYHVDSTVSMMGSEVDLAVESILPKDCTNIDGDVVGSNLITELAGSVIFRQNTPPPKIRSPSYLRSTSVEHCLMDDSPSNSDTSLLSTPVVNSQITVDSSNNSEYYFLSQSSSTGAPNDYRRSDEIDDSEMINSICQDLLDEEILSVVFDVHRSTKCGLMFLLNKAAENADKYKIVDEFQTLHSGANDIFGQTLGGATSKSSKYIQQVDCLCPECNQPTAACRFAPHLEKCMGMGRNSFRRARTRLAANYNANSASSSSVNHFGTKNSTIVNQRNVACRTNAQTSWTDDDDDEDDDWYSNRKKGQKKRNFLPKSTKKKLKNTPLKKKQSSSSLASSQSNATLLGNHHSHEAILLSDLLDTPPLYSHDGDGIGDNSPRFVVGDEREMKKSNDGSTSIGDNDGGDFLDLSDGFDVPSPSL